MRRGVVAEASNPVMLDAIGKKSSVLFRLARKALLLRSLPHAREGI
jgi:3'-phosphoadenosine 5'-phosphosulfate sulfotransferase (PAPS reductase)/FAD synthetase